MARKLLLLTSALLLSLLALAGCTNNGSENDSYSSNTESSSPEGSETSSPEETGSASPEESESSDTAAACDSFSPGSAEQENCEAQGVPGTTEDPDRCGNTTPSPIASGIIEGTFGPYCENAIASTYDSSLVPEGADTTVTINETDAATDVDLIVRGFLPNTPFTATLHEDTCGAQASASGPEYTDTQNTQSRSLIMNFTTDDDGGSNVSITAPWVLPDDGIGRSLLISSQTSTASPGQSGEGAVGCISLER